MNKNNQHPLVGKLIIIEDGRIDTPDPKDFNGLLCEKTFKSMGAVERHVIEDARDDFDPHDPEPCDPEEWGSTVFVCQIVRVIKPVPRVKVSVTVVDVNKEQ